MYTNWYQVEKDLEALSPDKLHSCFRHITHNEDKLFNRSYRIAYKMYLMSIIDDSKYPGKTLAQKVVFCEQWSGRALADIHDIRYHERDLY